jgi:peptidoglycan/xylan/chitin deacetylase (PgdA/CDA1 family)
VAARSAILAYHSLDRTASVISTTPELFRRQMERLATLRIPVVPLDQVRRTPGAVALTFDDAFRNVLEQAVPELKRHGFPATVFVVSGRCGGWNDWDQKGYAGIPRLPLMSWNELQELADAGIELGGHSVDHADLTAIPPEQAREQMRVCRDQIEQRTGRSVRWFAYPYGFAAPHLIELAREYYDGACGTELRYVAPESDPHALPRLDAYYLRSLKRFEQAVTGSLRGTGYIGVRRWLRRLRRIL